MINILDKRITRPNNATPYTPGDVVGGGGADGTIEFVKAAAQAGGGGYIICAQLITNNTVTLNGEFRLFIYNDVLLASADNTPYAVPVETGAEKCLIGYVDFVLNADGQGATLKALAVQHNANIAYKCSNTSLYGVLTATKGYIPAASMKFWVKLIVDQF